MDELEAQPEDLPRATSRAPPARAEGKRGSKVTARLLIVQLSSEDETIDSPANLR